jgi:hypothetical protein
MILLTWEELALVILFSVICGSAMAQDHWWSVTAAAVMIAAIVFAGYRAVSLQDRGEK